MLYRHTLLLSTLSISHTNVVIYSAVSSTFIDPMKKGFQLFYYLHFTNWPHLPHLVSYPFLSRLKPSVHQLTTKSPFLHISDGNLTSQFISSGLSCSFIDSLFPRSVCLASSYYTCILQMLFYSNSWVTGEVARLWSLAHDTSAECLAPKVYTHIPMSFSA